MKRLCLYLLTMLLPQVIYAADSTAIHEYKLSNGLKLIVKEDHRAPVVFSSVWYKVGASYEPRGITGISHALEHMMFRGTQAYGPGKLAEIVNTNGGEQNAMTAGDYTVYFQTLPADRLPLSFKLEADRMENLTLDKDAFAKEIQVVMEERRMRTEDDPQALTTEKFNAIALINDPYSRPVIGWMSDLQQLKIEDLRAWYKQWYAPNNAVVIVVGDVKPENVLALAKQYFGKLSAKSLPSLRSQQEVSASGTRHITVRIPAKLPWVVMGYNTPSLTTDPQSSDPYTLMVLAYLLGGSDSSRLNQDLVRGQQIAVSVSADYGIYNLYSNLLTLSATPAKSTSKEDLQQALAKEVARLQTDLVSPEELARAKASLVASHVYDQDSLMEQAINLGLPEVTGLSWQLEQQLITKIENVTAEQIRTAAKRYLVADNLTIGYLDPITQTNAPATTGEPHDHSTIIH